MLNSQIKSLSIFLFLSLFNYLHSQNYTNEDIKSAYIYKFSQNIEWPSETTFDKFKIGIYGDDANLDSVLNILAANKKIKNKVIEITQFSNINDILESPPQLLYISKKKKTDLQEIYYQLLGQNILLVSDDAKKKKLCDDKLNLFRKR